MATVEPAEIDALVAPARPAPAALAEPVRIGCAGIDVAQVEAIAAGARVELDPAALDAVAANQRALSDLIDEGAVIYGVTTGFGALVNTRVPREDAAAMQLALLRSHAAGVGAELPREVVRAAMAVRLASLMKGASGVRRVVPEAIAGLLNAGVTPYVPRTGSLGASGDLAPSAHAFLVLVGEGRARTADGELLDGADALARHRLEPIVLAPKEGLALINGTHFMSGIGALAVASAARLLDAADRIAAVTVDALGGTLAAFDRRVNALRPLPGQQVSAAAMRAALQGSARTTPPCDGPPQNAYSLRCVPQVHGAAREAVAFARRLVRYDLDAVTDNPIVLTDPFEVLSAGNFHGQSLALALDTLRIGLADLGAFSERRTFRLVSPSLNGELPAFLTPDPGRSSGLMIAQYTAAALVGELRALAQPVSIDSVPTSDSQEDHVSMGMTAAVMALQTLERLRHVLAIELLCATQALHLIPGDCAPATQAILDEVRRHVAPTETDRPPADDIARLAALVESPAIATALAQPSSDTSPPPGAAR